MNKQSEENNKPSIKTKLVLTGITAVIAIVVFIYANEIIGFLFSTKK